MQLTPEPVLSVRNAQASIYMAKALFTAGRYEEAADWAHRFVMRYENTPWNPLGHTHLLLAASYAHLDRIEEAWAAFEEAKQLRPDLRRALSEDWPTMSAWDPDVRSRYLGGLRMAGLEE